MTELVVVSTDEAPVLDVVFVHGLDGDARKSWSAKREGSFWPEWLGQDIEGVSVWSLDYDAASSHWLGHAMPIQDRAISLLAHLEKDGIGQRPLCFVTHSMGGLVVKEMLLHAADGRADYTEFATATRGVVFLATPHTGSDIVTKAVVKALAVVYRKTEAVDGLERNSAHLRQLNTRYRNWSVHPTSDIKHKIFYETRPTKGIQVVDAGSADPGIPGQTPISVDADHIDICKPSAPSDLVYGQIKLFVTGIITALRTSPAGAGHQEETCELDVDEALPYVRDVNPLDTGVKPSVPLVDSDSPIALWLNHKTPRSQICSYALRDHDADLRARLRRVVDDPSGAVILIGRSCTGKSRSAWEAVREFLPDWHFVNMNNPEDIERLSRAKLSKGGVVLWLDNLRSGTGVAGAVKAALAVLRDHGRTYQAVAVATMWHAPVVGSANQPTALADSFAMKELATYAGSPVPVLESWSDAERRRGWARSIDAEDNLLAAALRQRVVSPPQMLAGAHWTINLWQSPVKRETRSLLDAAIDLAILGFGVDPRMPLTLPLLRGATPAYLERPPESPTWFEDALAEATNPLEEAVWALRPPFPDSSGTYTLFDPLLEFGKLVRFHEPLPETVWRLFAMVGLTRFPLEVLARSAGHRLLHPLAAELELAAAAAAPTPEPPAVKPELPVLPVPRPDAATERQALSIKPGFRSSSRDRADQLLADDNYDELVELAVGSNDSYVRRRLAKLYERHGEIDKLRQLASFSNRGGRHFVEHLCATGNLTELLRMIAAGDGYARRAIEDWAIVGLSEEERQVILAHGLNPDGTPRS
ncbi:esterase/lipase family protein [Amycolatopsis oliviviridis]|uniref:esterase/lipase family protein n=1 Tax=Amycolatopsis oliviviridis TaxID=1471590 RepID=UPI0017483B13|nr:hypothetical protein [Amycolatopsis oliviviridis]